MKLLHKKAIVTGANRSIGKAIALAFAREGADVLISYRSDAAGAKTTLTEIEKIGHRSKALYADFSTLQGVSTFFAEALDFLKEVDILVNNAAGYNTKDFFALSAEEFEQLLKINLTAPMLLTQLTAKHMVEKQIAGRIINISSISGERPYLNRVAPAAAKAGLNMLTKGTALELAPYNIRVNAIAPGITPYEEGEAAAEIPLKRNGKPADHAHAAVYLASDDSSWLTGQVITIDGGQSLSFGK